MLGPIRRYKNFLYSNKKAWENHPNRYGAQYRQHHYAPQATSQKHETSCTEGHRACPEDSNEYHARSLLEKLQRHKQAKEHRPTHPNASKSVENAARKTR